MDAEEFQSLGRDSGCSGELSSRQVTPFVARFNPSGGILVVQACKGFRRFRHRNCFNPSGGILVVQARIVIRIAIGKNRFQSLGRDSGCSGAWRHC